ncbi:MAG: hypothetical protein Rubg2KO_01150 [Rubricoccaceae bacterium]
MSDLRFQKVTPRQTHLKTAASSLSSGLGATPGGMASYKVSFYKLGELERGAPSYSVQVPKEVAEMLSRPGSLRHVKVEAPAVDMFLKLGSIDGEPSRHIHGERANDKHKGGVVFQVHKIPS